MDGAELGALLFRLKANQDAVPRHQLLTTYRDSYKALWSDIWAALVRVALEPPAWLAGREVPRGELEDIRRMARAVIALDKPGLLAAARTCDLEKAMAAAAETRKRFHGELSNYVKDRNCLCVPVHLTPSDGEGEGKAYSGKPLLYNYGMGCFWDDDRKRWRLPRPGEPEPDRAGFWEV